MTINTWKCDKCGRFIAIRDFDEDRATLTEATKIQAIDGYEPSDEWVAEHKKCPEGRDK